MMIIHSWHQLPLVFKALVVVFSLSGVLFASPSEITYSTFEEAAQRVFPNLKSVTKNITLSNQMVLNIEEQLYLQLPTTNITIYEYYNKDELVGRGMVTNQIGKYYPITFFVAITPANRIKEIVVLVYREEYGRNIRKRRFLKQFKGKSLQNPIAVNNDITSLSGATLSSYAIANGARRVLAIIDEVL